MCFSRPPMWKNFDVILIKTLHVIYFLLQDLFNNLLYKEQRHPKWMTMRKGLMLKYYDYCLQTFSKSLYRWQDIWWSVFDMCFKWQLLLQSINSIQNTAVCLSIHSKVVCLITQADLNLMGTQHGFWASWILLSIPEYRQLSRWLICKFGNQAA